MLVGVMVGDPIGFTVLKHVYHFKTEILFKDLQNNFYTKNNFVKGAHCTHVHTFL